jgi:hypothetical protein
MNEFQSKVYKSLLSDAKRFSAAKEIHDLFPIIRKEMLNEFWSLVKKELDVLVKDSGYIVVKHKDICQPNSRIYLHLPESKYFRITYEHLCNSLTIGISIWYDKVNKENTTKYHKKVENEFKGWDTKGSNYWLAYKDEGDDFNEIDSLILILSDGKESYAKEKAQTLFAFAMENKKHIEYLNANCLL